MTSTPYAKVDQICNCRFPSLIGEHLYPYPSTFATCFCLCQTKLKKKKKLVPFVLVLQTHLENLGCFTLVRLQQQKEQCHPVRMCSAASVSFLCVCVLLFFLGTTVVTHWDFFHGKFRLLSQGKPAATELHYPSYGAFWVF